ncbi:hypothetical protein ACHAXT_006233 [Thalassiosira profunda]
MDEDSDSSSYDDVVEEDASSSSDAARGYDCAASSASSGIFGRNSDWVSFSEELGTSLQQDVENNKPKLKKLHVIPYEKDMHDPYSNPDELPYPMESYNFISLGENIGKNTNLEKLVVRVEGFDWEVAQMNEGSDVDFLTWMAPKCNSKENLDAFLEGVSSNRSIQSIKLDLLSFELASMDVFSPFVVGNLALTEIKLHGCGIGTAEVQELARAMGQRKNPSTISTIEIIGISSSEERHGHAPPRMLTDDSAGAVVDLVTNCPGLKKLDLSSNQIGDRGCTELASLLESPNASIQQLIILGSRIRDEGVMAFAGALRKNNTTLKKLRLAPICELSDETWKAFSKVICDKSSIDATLQSNHTLQRLQLHRRSILTYRLIALLRLNRGSADERSVAHQKMHKFHLSGNFDLAPFYAMDLNCMPLVLGFVGNASEELRGDFSIFHRIVRNFPQLCSFPRPPQPVTRKSKRQRR